ncbi:hypothetical protein NUM3379_27490 [Kineococcus sp. NUM-3379]
MRQAVQRLFWGGLAGKVLGLVREVLLATAYGTTAPAAASRIAQTGTLVPVNFLLADALAAGFLPLHATLRTSRPAQAATLFHVLRVLLWALSLLLAAVLWVAAPGVVPLLAPGVDARTAALSADFLRVMALGIPSYLQFALLSYLEMSHGEFRLAGVRAVGQNVGMVAGVALAWSLSRPVLLAWGFTAAYLLLHAWARGSLRRRGLCPGRAAWVGEEVRALLGRLWVRLRPLLLLPVLLQGSVVAERVVASLLGTGTVAAVDYARFVADTGVALLAVPLGFAGLAVLAGLGEAEARARLESLLPAVLVVVVPASTVLFLNSTRVVQVLYGRGAFDAAAVATSASVLAGLAVGFWAQTVSYVLVRALNARDRNGRATRALAAGCVVVVLVDVGLYRVLGPLTLGLAASLGAVVTTALAAWELGVAATTARWLGRCAPGAVLALAAGSAVSGAGQGWAGLLLCTAVMGAVWAAYLACVPSLRSAARGVLRRRTP